MTFEELNDTYNLGEVLDISDETMEKVLNADRRQVWTLIDGNNREMWVSAGLWGSDRIGYFISLKMRDENQNITVKYK